MWRPLSSPSALLSGGILRICPVNPTSTFRRQGRSCLYMAASGTAIKDAEKDAASLKRTERTGVGRLKETGNEMVVSPEPCDEPASRSTLSGRASCGETSFQSDF